MSRFVRAQMLMVSVLLGACGPLGPSEAGEAETGVSETSESETGESETSESETGEPDDGAMVLVAEYTSECDGVGGAVALADGGAVIVGGTAVINGWIARFDGELELSWARDASIVYADVDLGADESLWVAAGSGGQAATIERYDLDGELLAAPAQLELPDDLQPAAIARMDAGWMLGGRSGEYPFDAWLAELDDQGATLTTYVTPTGGGNVSSSIQSIDASAGLTVACGTAGGGGEWGWPWLLLSSPALPEPVELTGESPQLGVRSCFDVAARGDRFARVEGANPYLTIALDASGEELWRRESPEAVWELAFAEDGVLFSASNSLLRAHSPDGEELWAVEIEVEDLSVRDLIVLADGGVLVAGNTPGSIGECSDGWLGLYR